MKMTFEESLEVIRLANRLTFISQKSEAVLCQAAELILDYQGINQNVGEHLNTNTLPAGD